MRKVSTAVVETHEASPPRSFLERIHALLGRGGWRDPRDGGYTGSVRSSPLEHDLAGAMGYMRRMLPGPNGVDFVPDPLDIGPLIVEDELFQRTRHANPVIRVLAGTMAEDRSRIARRNRAWLRVICWAAYVELVHGSRQYQLRPAEVDGDDWVMLTTAAKGIMEHLRDDALSRAERAMRARRAG